MLKVVRDYIKHLFKCMICNAAFIAIYGTSVNYRQEIWIQNSNVTFQICGDLGKSLIDTKMQ